jgi:hypothetical protein
MMPPSPFICPTQITTPSTEKERERESKSRVEVTTHITSTRSKGKGENTKKRRDIVFFTLGRKDISELTIEREKHTQTHTTLNTQQHTTHTHTITSSCTTLEVLLR